MLLRSFKTLNESGSHDRCSQVHGCVRQTVYDIDREGVTLEFGIRTDTMQEAFLETDLHSSYNWTREGTPCKGGTDKVPILVKPLVAIV